MAAQAAEVRVRPLAIDLFCGLGGWTEGLLSEGYRVVGFDNERHVYGDERYPAQLVIQDVLTIHGRQFKDAALIVASPPCQAYSYRAMPWKKAKALGPPDNALFEACFRIQAEAIDAAGHHIPLIVENVRGAQPYVGRSKHHFGSFYLWGDIPALMPRAICSEKKTDLPPVPLGDLFRKTGIANVCHITGTKQPGIGGLRKNGKGDGWFQDGPHARGSKSNARKRSSAMIAKIPLVLSRHIAAAWYPREPAEMGA